jgi:hypothetical protein
MYDNRGIDKSSSNISKISSIKSKSSSINKYKSSTSANKKKELWSKMKNIHQQNMNDKKSYRCGKYYIYYYLNTYIDAVSIPLFV